MIDAASILRQTSHRPWPLPSGPWIMEQGWYGLLFAHWPLSKQELRGLVPRELELDTFAGEAWVSITPFNIRMRPRGLFALGRLWCFPELNCRTYVRFGGDGGIYFFSLDAGSLSAVLGARVFFRLPYFHSRMRLERERDSMHFRSERRFANASFVADYKPVSPQFYALQGTLEHWLTERYCLFTVAGNQVFRTDIHHAPWPLQKAEAEISFNTVARQAGLNLEGAPALLEYAEQQEVLVWPLRKAGSHAIPPTT